MALTEVGARLRLAGAPAFSRGAKDSANSLERLGKQAGQADRKVTGLERAAKRARSALGSIAKGAALGALGAGVAGVAGGVAFLAKGLQDASDLSETLSKSATVFGKASDEVRAWAYDSTKNILMTREAAISGAATFGNLFVAMGVGQKPAADLSTSLVGLASDLASFNNVDTDEALQSLRSGLLGEAEPLRKFGVQLSAARIEAEAVEMGLVKLTKGTKKQKVELTAAQKAQAAYSVIMKDTKVAQGDAERTQDGFANSTRKLRKNIADARAEIGMKLLPTAERLTKWANDVAVPAMMKLADEFQKGEGRGGKIRDTLQDLGNKARDMAPHLQTAYDKTKQVVNFFIRHDDAVKTFAVSVGLYATAMKAASVWTSAMAAINFGKIALGIGAVGTASGTAAGGVGALTAAGGAGGAAAAAKGVARKAGIAGVVGAVGGYVDSKWIERDGGRYKDTVLPDGRINRFDGKTGRWTIIPAPKKPGRAGDSNRKPTARQYGGPAIANRPHLVGEREPEIFVPSTSGRINTPQQHAALNGDQRPIVVNVNTEFNGYNGSAQDADRLVAQVRKGVRQGLARL